MVDGFAVVLPWIFGYVVGYCVGRRKPERSEEIALGRSECAFPDCECPGEGPVCDDYRIAHRDGAGERENGS